MTTPSETGTGVRDAPPERRNLQLMREMFGRIAPRYDFVTRTFSYGMDPRWKRLGVIKAGLADKAVVLDLASGTGDFSDLVRKRIAGARSICVDLSEEMLLEAQRRGLKDGACGDATRLPFADGTFDCVFIGYGVRNFPDLKKSVREIERVTRPGGMMVSLDFFMPANRVFRDLYLGYLYVQGAAWGLVLHGRPRTYTYISDSIRNFTTVGDFSTLLEQMGYSNVD